MEPTTPALIKHFALAREALPVFRAANRPTPFITGMYLHWPLRQLISCGFALRHGDKPLLRC